MEGINMGRQCPWSKEYIIDLYEKLKAYSKSAALASFLVSKNEVNDDVVAMIMCKQPIIYLFVHYHFGKFEDLKMNQKEISRYLEYIVLVKEITKGIKEGLMETNLFKYDKTGELREGIIKVCDEVLYIENNFK